MIVVAVGVSEFPFDRLLRAVADVSPGERVVVQHGPSAIRPAGAECTPLLPLEQLAELVREARIVVTHAGVGSILLALANGKRPYVVPRRRRFGETVDDHQLESARRFATAGLVTLVEDPSELATAILDPTDSSVELPSGPVALVSELRDYLGEVTRRRLAPQT